ncbi:c-type cytochrome [Campylobacter sp. MG1]|uniref:c-type cytochrome n=1 Tax=Campylobacter sp. MG1 TaxID=2976332 RepID=UPI00226C728A|nr:c-type cytochrome [Campylobacter sp. MG1]
MKKILLSLTTFSLLGTCAYASDGAALFKTCATCHGKQAEKSALNKSKIIADFSEEEIIKSLKGYQDDTYGGASKALMKPNVKKLNDDDIKALASYIVSLKK